MRYKYKFVFVIVILALIVSVVSFVTSNGGNGGLSIFIAMIVLFAVIRRFINRCKKCGSWKTRIDVQSDTDNHRPNFHFISTQRICLDCGETRYISTVGRSFNQPGEH